MKFQKVIINFMMILILLNKKTLDAKLEVLNNVNDYLRKKDSTVKQVTASFSGEQKSIEIIRSGGEGFNGCSSFNTI